MTEVHQILPSFSYGDAIGNNALEIRDVLRKWGYKSDIYAEHAHPKMSKFAKNFYEYKKCSSPDNILIFHYSIGSEVSRFVKTLPDKLILIYHNITPHHYFMGINDGLAHLVKGGKETLPSFNGKAILALGDSEYNRQELAELGFKNTGVLPIIIDFEKYDIEPNRRLMRKYGDGYVNVLFVGRIIPNKKYEDIIKAFYYYKKGINPRSRLFLAGSYEGTERYYRQLQDLIRRLRLEDVYFTGHTDFRDLVTYYKLADILLCMSEHEGFCVPLLESMYFKIPIIAYNSTAVPYTLKNSGVLINQKNFEEIAEMMNILVEDEKLRSTVIKKQEKRLKDFEKSEIERTLKSYIKDKIVEK